MLKYLKNGPALEALLIGAASISLIAAVGTATASGKHSAPRSAPVGCVSPPVGNHSGPVGSHSGPVGHHSGPVGCHSAPVAKPSFKFNTKVKGDTTVGSSLTVNATFNNRGSNGRFTLVTTVKDSKGRVVATWTTNNVRIAKNDMYTQVSTWNTATSAAGKYTVGQAVKIDGKIVASDKKTATVHLRKAPKR